MALIDFDKFLASFITEMKKYQPITCYNLPGCIKKALEDQGLDYKNGEIVKIQRRVSAEAKENGYGESEYEKVINEIINTIKGNHPTHSSKEIQKMVDWLENIPYTIDHEKREGFQLGYKAGLEKQNPDISSFPKEQQVFMKKYTSFDKITLIKLLAERDANSAEIIESFEKQGEWKSAKNRVISQPKQEWDGTEIAPPIDSDVCG